VQRSEFVVNEDGLLSERTATEHAAWYTDRCSELEPLAVEAQIMLMRAYAAIDIDGPFERKRGLSKARYTVLRMLHASETRRLPMTAIGINMNVSPTNVTKLVDGLEKDGYVRRVTNTDDKRRVWVEMLPEGVEALEDTYPDVVQHVKNNWADFKPEDMRVLIHLLAKLRLDILTHQARSQLEATSTLEGTSVSL
jgi:DNA-binding MarR family transcriptional regulator